MDFPDQFDGCISNSPSGSNEKNPGKGFPQKCVQGERANKVHTVESHGQPLSWREREENNILCVFMASPRLEGQVEKTVFHKHLELQWRKQCLLVWVWGVQLHQGCCAKACGEWDETSPPSLSLLPVLCWSDPTRSQLALQPGWHGLWGHPPGAQSRTDRWSWVGGGGDANDKKKLATVMMGSLFQESIVLFCRLSGSVDISHLSGL